LPPPPTRAAGFQHRFVQMSWQALPSYSDRLREWLSPAETDENDVISARAEAVRLFFEIQNQVLVEVIQHLRNIGLEYCLLKGTAHRFDLYRRPSDRGGIDLDVAIPETASVEGRRAAQDLGFVQSAWDEEQKTFVQATKEQQAWIDDNHYELGFLIRRHAVENLSAQEVSAIHRQIHLQPNPWHFLPSGGLGIWINLDLHTGLSHDIPVAGVMGSSRILQYRACTLRIPSRPWQLLHTIYKLYWEGVFSYGKGLYQFADICRLVPRLTDDESIEFLELLEKWRLEAGGRYILSRLPSAFDISITGRLEDFLGSSAVPRLGAKPQEENNFGDVWSKLWGYR
ncbi:hypothetical protein EOA88_09550, partial [Mesorhizobium sp. M5C.F.Ca.IN.020.14.1.1]